jgi:hypothetical protein
MFGTTVHFKEALLACSEKEEATRSLLAEQAEKMAEIERERAKAQELMEEARKLRDGYLERKKNGDQEVLS